MLMAQCILLLFFMFLDGNGCVAKAGKFMGGCLDFKTYADAECHVYRICCDDIDWIKCSCQNVRDIYHKGEDLCQFGKFSRR
jgi:hypothetical protein